MKILRQLGIILAICFAGELIHTLFNLPIPGNIIGMLLLFLSLCTGLIKLEMIEDITKFLLDHLAFFFIPAGVGLISCISIVKDNWISITFICVITTIIVTVVTGHTVQLIKRGRNG